MPVPFNIMSATGDAVLKRKELEYSLNSILTSYVNPSNKPFFTDVMLHGSLISLQQKILLVASACKANRTHFDAAPVQRIASMLDLLVMQSHMWQSNGAFEDAFQGEFSDLSALYNALAPEYLKVEASLRALAKEI